MKFTIATVVSLLAGSAIAAPAEMKANKATDMSAGASSIANMRLADMFSERQMAVLKVLSEHQQELGMSQEEKHMLDAFMTALNEAVVNAKRQAPLPVPALTPAALNTTAPGSLGSTIGALDGVNSSGADAPTGIAGAVGDAASGAVNTAVGSATDVLSILKNIPALAGLLANATGTVGGATSGLGSATSGLSGLTGLNGALGGLTGGLGGLRGLAGLLSRIHRGGLLGGILIPGIL
ncbi:hypothetical protein MKX08_002716 [Trichoderma sp. CBMAI-0020]|nr:hypothetical protein MKX08_002716 [Trichoderma sp. CBMAI-0020]